MDFQNRGRPSSQMQPSSGFVNSGFARSVDELNNASSGRMGDLRKAGADYSSMTEVQYREYLVRTFKPIFEPYEKSGGIECQNIMRMFQNHDYGLPRLRREELLLRMDANKDGKIRFKEFERYLVNKRYHDLNRFHKFGLCAVLAANPGMRLRAAKYKVRRKIGQHITGFGGESEGRGNQIDSAYPGLIPDPITGGYKFTNGQFQLEPDGVWPTSRKSNDRGWKHSTSTGRVTIHDECYIPQSYLDAYNCRPPPIFIPIIVIVQVAIFIYYAVQINQLATTEPWNAVTWTTGWPYFSPLYYDPRRRRECWRFLTYMFIHSGIEHILLNSIFTLILGLLVEWVNKLWRVFPVYMAGVFLGCLGHSVLEPNVVLVGASGGVYALVGAHLALCVMNWEEMQHDWTNIRQNPLACLTSGVTRLLLIFGFLGFDFAFALYRRFGLPDEQTVSFMAHVFGFIAGLLIGIPVLKNVHEKPWERVLFWVCLTLFIALVIFGILFNILWPGYSPQTI